MGICEIYLCLKSGMKISYAKQVKQSPEQASLCSTKRLSSQVSFQEDVGMEYWPGKSLQLCDCQLHVDIIS